MALVLAANGEVSGSLIQSIFMPLQAYVHFVPRNAVVDT